MSNNLKIEISPEEFEQLNTIDQKLHVIYKALVGVDPRLNKLEKRRLKDSGLSVLAGTIAGFIGGVLRSKIL